MSTITRREFNGAALAAMLLPAVKVPHSTVPVHLPPIDWSVFCDPFFGRDSRFDLRVPFVKSGIKCASDEKIMVWSVTDETASLRPGLLPPTERVISEMLPESPVWSPWPEPVYQVSKCPYHRCCPKCEYEDDDDFVCDMCHGAKGGPFEREIVVGGEIIDRKYDEKIRTLPGPIEWCLANPIQVGKWCEQRPMLFRWSAGLGAVCTMRAWD
jgi:hypothetical protein